MHSIRGRLTIMLVLSLGFLLLGSGALLYTLIRAQLVGEFDRVLLARAEAFISLTEDNGTSIELDLAEAFLPEFKAENNPEYFVLWRASGQVLARSDSFAEHDLPPLPTLTDAPVLRNTLLPNGKAGRLLEMAFVPRLDQDGTLDEAPATEESSSDWMTREPMRFPDRAAILLVARNRDTLDALLHTLQLALALVIAGVVAFMVVVVRLALRFGLCPLDDVRQQAERLDASSLTTGIQVRRPTSELAPVLRQFNALLRRLDAAFTRERQFSSDVAHELRTPLAELRTLTEVGLRWPDDKQTVVQYLADAQAIGLHMEHIVGSLLTLARCESGTQQVSLQPLPIRQLVEASWAPVARLAQEKTLAFQCTIPPVCCVTSDSGMLLTIVSNLLSNAVTYSPPRRAIHCVATPQGSTVHLTMSNPTDDLTPADMPHVFERFWRKDAARTVGDHAGLGLAIVQALSDLLHVGVRADLDAKHNFVITLSLPGAASA